MKNSTKNSLIVFLALIALGGGGLAWQQYLELVTLRAASGDPSDRAAGQARLAAAERYARDLEDQLDGLRFANEVAAETGALPLTPPANGFGRGRGRGGPENMRAMLDNPEVQKLRTQQQKVALDSRYAALFKQLNLPAAQLDQFKSLLLEKQAVTQDVMAAAREQGLDPRTNPEGFRQLIASAQSEIDANLKAVIGDEAFAQYEQFQQTQPQRAVLSQLQQSLSYTDAPLTETQSTQLLQILASTATQTTGGGGPLGAGGGGRGAMMGGGGGGAGPAAVITTETIAQAQTVLSAPQVQALQQLQQTQQAQQQLREVMRTSGGGGGGRSTRTPPSGE